MPTELGGLLDSGAWKPQQSGWLVWRRCAAAVGDAEGIAIVGQDVYHGLENAFDFCYNEAYLLVLGLIMWDLYDP